MTCINGEIKGAEHLLEIFLTFRQINHFEFKKESKQITFDFFGLTTQKIETVARITLLVNLMLEGGKLDPMLSEAKCNVKEGIEPSGDKGKVQAEYTCTIANLDDTKEFISLELSSSEDIAGIPEDKILLDPVKTEKAIKQGLILDFSLEENGEISESSNSEISNAIFNSIVNIEELDITKLTILLIENFVKLSDIEKEEFLNSEYFDLIKNHVLNIQNDDEVEFNNIFKDPKMLNEFESHIEALQQCVKERDDIINYYYQEIVNERIQNEKLLVFCENEQLEREETNKIISGLTKKIEMEEDYIKKLEVRCEMLIEKIKKYQSCCKHYEKSISLLSGKKSNSIKLINTQNIDNWKMNELSEPLSATSILTNPPNFAPTASQTVATSSNFKNYSVNINTNNKLEETTTPSSLSTSSATLNNEQATRPAIDHLINKLSTEKISRNEEVQYLKSLLKSYNGKHIYINENVIKRQIIKKTTSESQNIPATINEIPVIPISTNTPSSRAKKISLSKKMMMEKYLNDEKNYSKMEDTLIVSESENEYMKNEEQGENICGHETEYIVEEENEEYSNDKDEILINGGKSIDLSIIDDLNIFNEKHYQEKVLNKQQDNVKSYEDDTFSEYAPTLVN